MRALLPRRLAADRRGAAIVEFAIVAPVLLLLLLVGFDTAHSLWVRAALQGMMQKAARDSSLESGTTAGSPAALNAKVQAGVQALAINATFAFDRRFYRTFSAAAAAKAETYTDTNNNKKCDNGEPYVDANNNNVWDADGGDSGQGSAKDRVIYTVTMTYRHLFPFWNLVGMSNTASASAKTVLQNQPYGDQGVYGTATNRNCPVS